MKMLFGRALIAFVWFSGTVFAAPPSASAPKQIQPLLDEMMLAANAHDTDRFMALYARSPELVVTFDDMTMHGWQVVRDQQLQWWDNGKSNAVYSQSAAPEVTVISATVVATLQSMTVTSITPDGATRSAKVVATSVWKKLPEGWRILVAHESLIH
jgi:ketosteroid isomerase-like protein